MKRIAQSRLTELSRYLDASGLSESLKAELLDHLACETEERLWNGATPEEAMEAVWQQAGATALLEISREHRCLLSSELSLHEMVFEHRNKLYGAYALRQEYRTNILRAMAIGVGIFLLIFLLPAL